MKKICRICGQELTPRNKVTSHILTHSQYVAPLTKNTKGKLLGYGEGRKFDPTHEATDKYILCRNCDTKLGEFEEERGKLLQKLQESDFRYNNSTKLIDGIGGTKIKLACLADLFRCSITSKESYCAISLGNKHESNIIKLFSSSSSCQTGDYPTIFSSSKPPSLLKRSKSQYALDTTPSYRTEP